ncbi:MAG TPA: phage protein Gp37 [Xanthomonadaceae bacterium]
MSRIGDAEDALLNRVRTRFGTALKHVEAIPSSWDAATIKRMYVGTPGVFLSWGVQRGQRSTDSTAELIVLWEFDIVTSHEGKEAPRRRGDARAIGAYEIVERLIPLLHGWTVPNEGSLQIETAENKFSAENERNGLTVYGALFSMPMTMDDGEETPSDLDDFITFHADWDLAPADGQLEAQDHVTLPQD